MNPIAKKLARLLPALEAQGPVYLFAVVERADINLLDVVISSEQSDKDKVKTIRFVVDRLDDHLEPRDRSMLSRVAIVSSGPDSAPLELPEGFNHVSPEDPQVITDEFLGVEIKRAFVFKSNLPVRAVELA